MSSAAAPSLAHPPNHARGKLGALSLAALGVVYGDIGTSPLYSIKECFTLPHGVAVTEPNVLGIVSLFFWSLTLVIVVKYMAFVMRADNQGEGGILALLALLKPRSGEKRPKRLGLYLVLGLFGASLLYGDGVITPVVSILGAVEGLGVGNPWISKTVICGITIVIIVILFSLQRGGTARVGAIFGPLMLVWFVVIGVMGAVWLVKQPRVLLAVNPMYAASFFAAHGKHGFLVLGAVVLCITGGEALYADMGHFGKKPIRLAWFAVVFPALILNYFGQGALLLDQGPVENPFYAMVPGMMRYPLIALATFAASVASQALISGAFSLTQQAVQLGFWPRVKIIHTSDMAEGQIFIPEINAALMIGCIALVLSFGEASKLAAAYGIAVTGTMSITSLLFYGVARKWGWSRNAAGSLVACFLVVDLAFLIANLHKIEEGGWLPLAIAVAIFVLMTTWRDGRARLSEKIAEATLPMPLFLRDLATRQTPRVQGTAIFMTSNPEGAPPALLHHFKHNKMLHEQVVLLSIQTRHVPEVPRAERIQRLEELGEGLFLVVAAYGFMQLPDVIETLELCAEAGLQTKVNDRSFYLGRETLVISDRKGMARWRKILFAYLSRNARPAFAFFQIPSNRVVELGTHIEL
jgi:KUP system potassium uptake protein